jgi:hypothetical protein
MIPIVYHSSHSLNALLGEMKFGAHFSCDIFLGHRAPYCVHLYFSMERVSSLGNIAKGWWVFSLVLEEFS